MKIHPNADVQELIEKIDDAYLNLRMDEFKDCNEKLLHHARTHDDTLAKTIHAYYIANTYFDVHDFNTCESQLLTLLPTFIELESHLYILRCYNVLAIIESERAHYYECLGHYISALQVSKKYPELCYSSILSNNIGNLFVWLNEFERALPYLLDAYEYYGKEKLNKPQIKAIIVVNIIECYGCLQKYEESQRWYQIQNDEYTENVICVLDNLILVNKIEQHFHVHNYEVLPELYEKILRNVTKFDEYIYHFRTLLRTLKVCIDTHNREYARKIIIMMNKMNEEVDITTFAYDFAELKMQYYFAYRDLVDEDFSEYSDDYYKQSSKAFRLLRKTYAQSMILRLDLEKVKDERQDMIQQNEILEKDLELDPFTKLYNKIGIKKNSDERMKLFDENAKHALFVIDIDYFKSVNDVYGHKTGDEVLLQVVNVLKRIEQENILIGRFGGDEFIIFYLNYGNEDVIKSLASTLVTYACDVKIPADPSKHITFSVGLDTCVGIADFDTMFFNADKALYETKNNGRNGYSIIKK